MFLKSKTLALWLTTNSALSYHLAYTHLKGGNHCLNISAVRAPSLAQIGV